MSEENGAPSDPYRSLRSKLEAFETWPGPYVFKFIVPEAQLKKLQQLFEGHEVQTRPSKTGRYVSLTCERTMETSDAVIEVYRDVAAIDGVISL